MEIIDYVKKSRKRMALLILVPLLAGVFAGGVLLGQPQQYIATATVDPAALVGAADSQYTGSQGVSQFVSAFQATGSGPVVRQAVAEQTGEAPTALNNGLTITQRGSSASVSVAYTADKRAVVAPVVEAVATLTLKALFSSQVDLATARVDAAQKAVTDANAALGALTAKVKRADPQKAYEAQLSRVNALVQQQASLRATGNAVGAVAMDSSIASARAELDTYGPILTEYGALLTARDVAVADLNVADASLSRASAQLGAADPKKIVFVGGGRAVDRVATVTRTTIAVVAAAFLLMLLLFLMTEVMGQGRSARERAALSSNEPAPTRGVEDGPATAATVEPGDEHSRAPRHLSPTQVRT